MARSPRRKKPTKKSTAPITSALRPPPKVAWRTSRSSYRIPGYGPVSGIKYGYEGSDWINIQNGMIVSVVSSNIAALEYNVRTEDLTVFFRSGRRYVYNDVPERVAVDFYNTSSMGIFHWRYIRDTYPFTRIR